MPQENLNQYPRPDERTPESLSIENQEDQERLEKIRAEILALQQSSNPEVKFSFSDINVGELEPADLLAFEASKNWDEKSQALKEYDRGVKIHMAEEKAQAVEKSECYDPKTDSRANLAGAIRYLLIEKALAKREWKKPAK